MSIADDLQRLQSLRRDGALSDAEFAQVKAAILAGSSSSLDSNTIEDLAKQLAEVRYQIELMRIDAEWSAERRKYFIINTWFRSDVPSIIGALWIGLTGAGVGIIMMIYVFIFRFSTDLSFPLFCGALVTLAGIGGGFLYYIRAVQYARAFEAYRRRRNTIRPEQFAVT